MEIQTNAKLGSWLFNKREWFAILAVVLLLTTLSFSSLLAQAQTINMEELKTQFFSDLSQTQIVDLIESLDRIDQLTTAQLGAKYNWGYIPPDRTPPVSLAQWWDRQNTRERRNHRIQWFRDHYLELDVERAARELEMKDRLTRLYRELRTEKGPREVRFEKVAFPDTGDVDSEKTEEQPPPRETPPSTSSTKPERTSTPDSPEPSAPTNRTAVETDDTESSSPESEQSQDTGPEAADWQKEMDFGDQSVIYERVGDEIRAIRRPSPRDSHLSEQPDYQFPFVDERETIAPEDLPDLRTDTGVSAPGLRFYRSPSETENKGSPGLRNR